MDWQQEVAAAWGVTVEGLHGRGGNADVYAATQQELDRRVALKVILSSPTAPEVHERFRREARTVAMLVHPNIVPIFSFGVFGQAMVIMMPWYEASLSDAIRTHPLPVADARKLLDNMRSALAHAHSRGVVHRDVKPSNIMIDAAGAFVLADFGIAAVRDQTQLTRAGAVPGTPDYLAPEVIMGEPPGPAADLYALGATLFEAVSGTKVFPSNDPVSAAYQHVHGTTPRLDVPEDPQLATTISSLLSKDPRDRERAAGIEPLGDATSRDGIDVRPARPRAVWKFGLGAAILAAIGALAVSRLGGSGDAIVHEQLLAGRFVSVDPTDLTSCPRTAERLSRGGPGDVARVNRIVRWTASPSPDGELHLEFGGRRIDATLDGAPGRAGVLATVPGDLAAIEGTLSYLDGEGRLHRHRVTVPETLRWVTLSEARDSLQDGKYEAGRDLASPGGLPVGPRGNTSIDVSTGRKVEFVYLGAVIDEGLAIEGPRVAAEALTGTAYVRLCVAGPCGQGTDSELVELVASSGPERSAFLDPPAQAQGLRFVWPAGSDGRDTRLHEVCGLILPLDG